MAIHRLHRLIYRICVICGFTCLAVPAPAAIVLPVTIATTVPATDPVEVTIAVTAIASEDTAHTVITIGSPAIPATIARVVAVNKFRTLLIKMRGSATASLAHYIG